MHTKAGVRVYRCLPGPHFFPPERPSALGCSYAQPTARHATNRGRHAMVGWAQSNSQPTAQHATNRGRHAMVGWARHPWHVITGTAPLAPHTTPGTAHHHWHSTPPLTLHCTPPACAPEQLERTRPPTRRTQLSAGHCTPPACAPEQVKCTQPPTRWTQLPAWHCTPPTCAPEQLERTCARPAPARMHQALSAGPPKRSHCLGKWPVCMAVRVWQVRINCLSGWLVC